MRGVTTDRSPEIRAVLFDAVGTLIYPDPPVAQVYREIGIKHGCPLTEDEIRFRFREALAESFQNSRSTSEASERERWATLVSRVFQTSTAASRCLFDELWLHFSQPENWVVFADMAEIWRELRNSDLTIGIASNFDARLRRICQTVKPLNDADVVFCSSQLGYSKPDKRFFETIEEQLQLRPSQILLIGDDPECDVVAARAAGWQAVLVERGR